MVPTLAADRSESPLAASSIHYQNYQIWLFVSQFRKSDFHFGLWAAKLPNSVPGMGLSRALRPCTLVPRSFPGMGRHPWCDRSHSRLVSPPRTMGTGGGT